MPSGTSFVAMMQPANFGQRDDVALLGRLHPTGLRGIFVQPQVRPAAVIINEVTFKHAEQVIPVQHNQVIQTFTPNRTN